MPPSPVFDWTNRRVGEHDVQWFADGKRLLVAASGDLFIVDINKGRFDPPDADFRLRARPQTFAG